MTSNATYPKHPEPTLWSPVVDMFHGMKRSGNSLYLEAIPSRPGLGNNPMEAGR
jgi:hypothetical protein